MDEQLIKSGNLSLRRRSLLPGTGFFYPDSLDEDRSEERAREAIEGSEAIVVTDSDADGLGCIALVRELYDAALDVDPFLEEIETRLSDEDNPTDEDDEDDEDDADQPESSVALLAAGPHSLTESLEYVAEYADSGVDVFVCDIAPDEYASIATPLETICKRSDRVSWYDHHQWPEAVAESVGEAGVDLVVGDSDEECSTDVCLRSLDYEFDERFTDLAEVTRDHDLWLNEDPRSKDLADYAYWTAAEEYAAVVGAYRAAYKSIGPWTVGVTYGRCSQNEVADGLQEAGADAAVIVKPSGSASIRGSESFEQAHLVARQVDGGGHPKAAGCKPDIYDDMMDYAYHWTTEGETTKRVILAAFRRVAEDVAAEDEPTGE
jgi:oligoribonuclease NrnB/cAMP/cGMP phosphodiesterase (DHH superfamily)